MRFVWPHAAADGTCLQFVDSSPLSVPGFSPGSHRFAVVAGADFASPKVAGLTSGYFLERPALHLGPLAIHLPFIAGVCHMDEITMVCNDQFCAGSPCGFVAAAR